METFNPSYTRRSHAIMISLLLSLHSVQATASTGFLGKAFGNPSSYNTEDRKTKRKGKTRTPYGKETSSIDPPIPVNVTNLEDIGDAATSSIATGYTWTSDSLTQELYPSLSNSLALGIVYVAESLGNPLAVNASVAAQSGTPMMGPYTANAVIQYDLQDSVDYVYNRIIYPLDTNITTYLNANPSTTSIFVNQTGDYALGVVSQNLQNTQTSDSQVTYSSGTTVNTVSLNINNLITPTDGTNLTKSDSYAAYLALNELTAAQLISCAASLKIQGSSSNSSSSSSSSTTVTTSTSSTNNVASYTTLACSIPQAACMITNTVYNIIPTILTRLDQNNAITGEPLSTSDPNLYNHLTTLLTSTPIENLQTTYNMQTTKSDCLDANASDYPSVSNSVAMKDLATTALILEMANKGLKQVVKKQIAVAIINNMQTNGATLAQNQQNATLPQMFSLTGTSDINTLLSHDSYIGIPSNSTVCSLKVDPSQQTLAEKQLAIEAATFVDYLSDASTLPDPVVADIPITSDTAYIGGGVGLVDNTSNFSSSDASNITNSRTGSQTQHDTYTDMYKTQFAGFITNRSIPLGMLLDVRYPRQNIITVPALFASDGTQLNPTNSDPRASGYIPQGETCTSKEIESFAAHYRLQPQNSGDQITTSIWQQTISQQPNTGLLAKESLQLLAEIRADLYKEQRQLEKDLTIESLRALTGLANTQADLIGIQNKIHDTIKDYIMGSSSNSSSSGS
jgi:hypothetical protein